MGYLQASEMARLAHKNTDEWRKAVLWHLQCNHYPPIHEDFLPVAVEAIDFANDGDWDSELEYPNGLTRTVAHTIEGLHLEGFLNIDE